MTATDATSLAEAIGRGETTASAAMQASLDRLAARAELGATRHVDAAMGLKAAAAFDALLASGSRRAKGRFGGVPFLMKDLGNAAAGLAPLAGSAALVRRGAPDVADSALAKRFRRSGLLPFGLTTTPEFGLSLSSEPPGLPPARNPFDPRRTAGGSSGGAAAAVAAGIVAIAHATDAAGSIRVPAACCGLIGLKPTRGATPNGPSFGNHLMGLVSELVVARSVRDVAAALDICAGVTEGPYPDPDFELYDLDGIGLRIGVPAGPTNGVGAEQWRTVESAADHLASVGHRRVELRPDTLDELARRASAIAWLILSVSMADWIDWLGLAETEMSPLAHAAVVHGRGLPATGLFAADREAALVAHALWRLFGGVDVILTPMLASAPPLLGAFPVDHTDLAAHTARVEAFAPYAALANVAGTPALAIPHGRDAAGLPLSVQLIGPQAGDRMLLHLAADLERLSPWTYPDGIAGHP